MSKTLKETLTDYVEEALIHAGSHLVERWAEYEQYEVRFGGRNISLALLDKMALNDDSAEPPVLITINLFQGLQATIAYWDPSEKEFKYPTKCLREVTFNQTPEQTAETLSFIVESLRKGRQI